MPADATGPSLTKGGLDHLPAFLRPIQQSIDDQNARARRQRLATKSYWVQRFVRVCVHIHVCKESSAARPGAWADWWTWIRQTPE